MEQDKFTHVFKPNSTLENALNLYYFDKELRVLIFRAIQSIEIALPIIPVFGIAIFPICHNYPNACQKHG